MARPNHSAQRRRELTPIVAKTFAEFGFRRTTTAELAGRCGVRENVLYRLWPDKKAMFIAAIAYVYELSATIWGKLLAEGDGRASTAARLLEYESTHHGEFGLYRIVFAGLSETDDPEIRDALAEMYRRYHRFIQRQISAHRAQGNAGGAPDATVAAWAVVGLGTV
jgi:AcrR family transcriptional regulator